MANLNGQNIGTNYKGILNLNTLNGNLSGTLQAVTDGDGNASSLQLSTSLSKFSANLIIGAATTALARLHVRGDGSNPIARFEVGGTEIASISNSGIIATTSYLQIAQGIYNTGRFNIAGPSDGVIRISNDAGNDFNRLQFGGGTNAFPALKRNGAALEVKTADDLGFAALSVGTLNAAGVCTLRGLIINEAGGNVLMQPIGSGSSITLLNNNGRTINITPTSLSGATNFPALNITQTWNTTESPTAIFLNITNTASGVSSNLMDLQVGGVSRFRVSRVGNITTNNFALSLDATTGADGNIILSNSGETSFGMLKFGQATNGFPALKRNAATLEVKLGDDTGFAALSVGALTNAGEITFKRNDNAEVMTFANAPFALDFGSGLTRVRFQSQTVAINALPDSSAALTIASTTKGFLPPRMTTTQVNAITSPAAGLVVYSTTENQLCLYNGTSWRKINDSPL